MASLESIQKLWNFLDRAANLIREAEGTSESIPVNTMKARIAAANLAKFRVSSNKITGFTLTESSADPVTPVDDIDYLRQTFINFGNKVRSGSEEFSIDDLIEKEDSVCGVHADGYDYDTLRIPAGIATEIDSGVFSYHRFKNVKIPEGFTTIGYLAFSGSSLTNIDLPNSLTTIIHNAFSSCYDLTSVSLPASLTSLGFGAFSSCSGLRSITIPSSVTRIEHETFAYCTGLETINISEGVTQIDREAFSGAGYNAAKVDITLPSTLVTIGNAAFQYAKLKSLFIPESLQKLSPSAFQYCPIENVTVDPNNTTFDSRNDCNAIIHSNTNVLVLGTPSTEIPSSVTEIGAYAFSGRPLTNIIIPNSVTTIEDNAFSNCSSLSSITIPSSVTDIMDHAFYNTGLTTITLPESVTELRDGVFENCKNLSTVSLDHITYIGNSTFEGSNITISSLSNSITNLGQSAFAKCPNITSVEVNVDMSYLPSQLFQECRNLETVVLPEYIKTIDSSAFFGASSLSDINLSNVTNLGYSAFESCRHLETVDLSSIQEIGGQAFAECSSLQTVSFGNDLSSIGSQAFEHCSSLHSITIPYWITSIGERAFRESGLQDIYYNGSIDDCKNRGIDWVYALEGTYITVIHCNDGDYEISGGSGSGSGSGSGDEKDIVTTLYPSSSDPANFEDYIAYGSHYYEIVPQSSDNYYIYLNSAGDSYGILYDSSWQELTRNDSREGSNDFCIEAYLDENNTYYLEVKQYNDEYLGSCMLHIDTTGPEND